MEARVRLISSVIISSVLISSTFAAEPIVISPTTTLTREKGNNTSAPDAFPGTSNGNLPAGNVSKLPVRSLMYPGANPKMLVALMGWFGKSSHISVGYASNDPAQVAKQMADMKSRGFDGATIAWYGSGTDMSNLTAAELLKQAQAQGGFSVALRVNEGMIKWNSLGKTPTDALIYHLNFAAQNYFSSSAYLRYGGRPVVFEFGMETYDIDWDLVRASVQGNPLFIFRNAVGYTRPQNDGAYAWGPADSISYLDWFYAHALGYPTKLTFGNASKGFNDTIASWTKNRIISQQCGQTWLNTFANAGKYYSSGNQLPFMQITTWNDYEEGTSIETGIDNCLSISASRSGNTLSWALSGTGLENTIDHYMIFVSVDGENLMPLTTRAAGVRSLDLASYYLGPGTYTLFVKAVGKPSIANKISGGVSYAVANVPPTASIYVSPSTGITPLAVTADTSGSIDPDGSISASTIDFGDGTIVAASRASHTYSVGGTYTVKATIKDNLGAAANTSATVLANRAPVVKLAVTPASGVGALQASASTAGSYDPDGTIRSTRIDFGDGYVTTYATASHTYTSPGTFTVKASVTDNSGYVATSSLPVTVYAGVKILSPTGSAVSPKFWVSATGFSSKPIVSTVIYIDGIQVYQVNSYRVDTYVKAKPGSHTLMVKSWNSEGTSYKATKTITAQ